MRASRPAVAAFAAATFVGTAVLTGPAAADVRFDVDSGRGFVGGADVRKAFGWTGAELGARARGVSFAYVDSTTYRIACRAGSRAEVVTAHTAHEKVVADKPRRRGAAVLGFDLRGYAGETSSTDLHQREGEQCDGVDAAGSFSGVWGPVETTSAYRGLAVRHRFQERRIA